MKQKITYLLILILLFQSCSIERFIPEDERLYTGATLNIKSDTVVKNKSGLKTELEKVIQPKPNKKFLGSYLGLYYYYKTQPKKINDSVTKKKGNFFSRWMYKRVGEEPVYQSDVEAFEIEELLLNRLENRGFFYSQATSSFEEKEKKASAEFNVRIKKPYTMAKFELDTLSPPIYKEMISSLKTSKFKEGMRFDLANMKQERERIDNNLKKKGYYNFNPGFLIFEADTNQYKNKRFNLFLKLKKGVPKKAIRPYKVSKINVFPNSNIVRDSTNLDTVRFNKKNFIRKEEFFKPKYLDPYITIQEGQFYNPETSKNTARRLSTIGAYKYVNIQYNEIDSLATDSLGILEAEITLSPLNKRSLRAEAQGVTKSNGFTGPGIGLTYANRNLFHGGEILSISSSIGYEVQVGSNTQAGTASIELGLKGELVYPRLLFPLKINNDFFKYSIPKTRISAGINYLSRTGLYTLVTGTAGFGYLWNSSKTIMHEITPISINYTKLGKTTEEFDDILEENPFLRRSFDQQFIAGMTYSFTYNGMLRDQRKHQFFANATFDIAGNAISLLGKAQDDPNEPDTFLALEYAQYIKADLDLRYHWNFGNEQQIATRLFGGYGFAYGNSEVLPFTKQYFSGGPYSVRAFRIRSLGPGTFNGENNEGSFFDQTGNVRLEGNVEYRFPIMGYFKGAVFADAGNIWITNENDALPGGQFSNNFLSQLGIGAGIGLRIDVQGFVIRFDLATPINDPREGSNENSPILNFAIGYPF